jgi:catechol 2,3-dioxygenase-like lactoylglutathione lyase family enzyme
MPGQAGDRTADAAVHALIPFVHVADVARSIAFYEHLGFATEGVVGGEAGPDWALLRSGDARLMLARAGAPFAAAEQAVLFYLYGADLAGLRARLLAAAIAVGPIAYPDHMPAGELRVEDPDGYVLLIGQRAEGG